MEQLFAMLTKAVEGAPVVALAAALIWGMLSIALSPCHLASIPLIVGFIAEQRGLTTRRACWTATVFSLGILVTISVIGVITRSMGRMAGDLGIAGQYLNYGIAAIFFLVGLHLLNVISLPFSGSGQIAMKRKGLLAAFLLGLIFGVALGPCTFAFMIPVLGATALAAESAPLFTLGLVVAYGIGHCGVIAAAGASTEIVQRYLHWNENSSGMRMLKNACGLLVILGGLYLVYTAH